MKNMSEDYKKIWESLNLDLAAHDALLDILGKGYQDILSCAKKSASRHGLF